MENMRYFLSGESSNEAHYFGYPYKVLVGNGYVAGGPSYVWSKETLRRFGTRDKLTCPWEEGSEDVTMGHCMERLNVTVGDTRDNLNRTRFHVFGPNTHIEGGYPDWFYTSSRYPPHKVRDQHFVAQLSTLFVFDEFDFLTITRCGFKVVY
jgi:glycoprotein-N-acetylgalactosamine 3-beta-galactosyltransferase